MPFSRGSSQPWDWTCVSYVSCTDRGFFTTDITWEAYSIGFTNSLIFTIYGMARQSIISSVLDRSHYNAWSKKEVWLLDIHPMFLQQHLRGHLYGSPTTGLTSLCVLCNTSFDWPGGNVTFALRGCVTFVFFIAFEHKKKRKIKLENLPG